MGIILLVLLLALILGGLGFAIHILWWIALIVLVIWLIGFVVRVGEGGVDFVGGIDIAVYVDRAIGVDGDARTHDVLSG